jgi:hypothetical protein
MGTRWGLRERKKTRKAHHIHHTEKYSEQFTQRW